MSSASPSPSASDVSTSSTPLVISSLPPPSSTENPGNNGEAQVVDDTDELITYFAPVNDTVGWEVVEDETAFNHTIHQTSCLECMATLLFNGTGLSLTSIISPQGAQFVVILDGSMEGPFTLTGDSQQPATAYTVEGLELAQHNATFMKSSNDTTDALFNIDSLTIISRPAGPTTVPATATGRTSTTQEQTDAAPTNTIVPVAAASSPPPIGAIVGGTIGGVALLVVLAVWIVIMRRRKSRGTAPAYTGHRYAQDRYAEDDYAHPKGPSKAGVRY